MCVIAANPTWRCDTRGCLTASYTENVEYAILDEQNGDCGACQLRCMAIPNCTAIECDELNGYCMVWFDGQCAFSILRTARRGLAGLLVRECAPLSICRHTLELASAMSAASCVDVRASPRVHFEQLLSV